jgi:hypothetical protein
MQTDFFKQYDVQPVIEGGSLKLAGLSKLSKSDAQSVIQYAKANKQQIINELSRPAPQLQIEPMDGCIHGGACEHLHSRAGHRPECLKAMDYIFDLKECPAGNFGPMSLAIGSELKKDTSIIN